MRVPVLSFPPQYYALQDPLVMHQSSAFKTNTYKRSTVVDAAEGKDKKKVPRSAELPCSDAPMRPSLPKVRHAQTIYDQGNLLHLASFRTHTGTPENFTELIAADISRLIY